jgi:nitrous oxide reductase
VPNIRGIARPDGTGVSDANIHVVAQMVRVYASREIESAEAKSSGNDLEGARVTIIKIRAMITEQDPNIQSHDLAKMIVQDLDEVEKGLTSTRSYVDFGHKEVCTREAAYTSQRCAEAEPERRKRHLYSCCITYRSEGQGP